MAWGRGRPRAPSLTLAERRGGVARPRGRSGQRQAPPLYGLAPPLTAKPRPLLGEAPPPRPRPLRSAPGAAAAAARSPGRLRDEGGR